MPKSITESRILRRRRSKCIRCDMLVCGSQIKRRGVISGIRVLLTIKKKIGNMKVLKPTDEVMEVLEITGLADVFDIEK